MQAMQFRTQCYHTNISDNGVVNWQAINGGVSPVEAKKNERDCAFRCAFGLVNAVVSTHTDTNTELAPGTSALFSVRCTY